MARNLKNVRQQNEVRGGFEAIDPNDLKGVVRDGLVGMTLSDRERFIQMLEVEMRKVGLNMKSYLIPLGIPARTLEELTPTEVGHLVRFLKINIPQSMSAVERALQKFDAFIGKSALNPNDRLAA
jgi:hypothetical protein